MPFPHTSKPFKTHLRRQVPNTVALFAVVLLLGAAAPALLPENQAVIASQDSRGNTEQQTTATADGQQPVKKVRKKLNIRLSLFRHG